MFPKQFEEGLLDGDMLAFSSCAALEYGKEPEDVNWNDIMANMEGRIAYFKRVLGIKKMRVFLSDDRNFRYDINSGYKANRVDIWRPYNLKNAKAYLVSMYDAEIVSGLEADDLMSIYQDRENNSTVIITLDKDLKQVPGCHYSWETLHHGEIKQVVEPLGQLEEIVKISSGGIKKKEYKGDGFLFFMHQCLVGDSTDGVLGCAVKELVQIKSGKKAGEYQEKRKGIGAGESYLTLKDCKTKVEAFQKVAHMYQCIFGNDWKEQLLITARCVHMLEELPDENGVVTLWHYSKADEEASKFSLKERVFLHG